MRRMSELGRRNHNGLRHMLKQMEAQSRHTAREISKMDAQAYEEGRNFLLQEEFNAVNMDNVMLMKSIEGVNPALAKHMIDRNDLLKAFAYKMGGGIDILAQPVCERCEGVGTWGSLDKQILAGEKVGYCDACGHVTKNPITVEQYLDEEVSRIDAKMLRAMRPRLNEEISLIDKEKMK